MEKLVSMQYPYSKSNNLYDGKEHMIQPLALYTNGKNIFILYYNDLDKNVKYASTILTRINGVYANVILTDYSVFNRSEVLQQFYEVPVLSLYNHIYLADTPIDYDILMQSKSTVTPYIELDRFIIYNSKSLTESKNFDNRIFHLLKNDKTHKLVFEKSGKDKNLEKAIRETMDNYLSNLSLGMNFEIEVNQMIRPGDSFSEKLSNGTELFKVYIPGLRKYRILMVPCLSEEKNNSVLHNDYIEIPEKENESVKKAILKKMM